MDLDVNSTKVKATAESLTAAADAIEEELRTLAAASTTLAKTWEGEAAVAYDYTYQRVAAAFAAKCDTLHAAASSLGNLADEYATADDKGAAATPH